MHSLLYFIPVMNYAYRAQGTFESPWNIFFKAQMLPAELLTTELLDSLQTLKCSEVLIILLKAHLINI